VGIDLKKKWHLNFGMSKIHLRLGFMQKKLTKMHWYVYNNTVPLLNMCSENSNISSVYHFKKIKFSTILSAGQPASLPAVRPGSTSDMAPDFSHKKGNYI